MAIKILLDESEWTEFVPEYMGNRELNKKERVACQIKFISQEDQDRLTDALIGDSRKGFRKQSGVKWSGAHNALISSHVKEIKNVSVVREGKEEAVSTMAQMYKIPHLKELYREISEALDVSSRLEEFEVKN